MTLDHAAQAAADRDELLACYRNGAPQWERDLYVRAFRAGAQWQQQQEKEHDDDQTVRCADGWHRSSTQGYGHQRCVRCGLEWDFYPPKLQARVETLTNAPRPSTGSTASTDKSESEQRGKS